MYLSNLHGSLPLTGPNNVFAITKDYFSNNKSCTLLADMDDNIFEKLLYLALKSDIILINNTPYTQSRGIAMGNNLSPMVAIIYMNFIERQILISNPQNILMWRRYIDDIFVIIMSPLDDLLISANTVSSNIIFTLEVPSDDSLPFLDMTVHQSSSNTYATNFYSKQMHSNSILPWDSYTPFQRKLSLIRSEKLRAARNSTTTLDYSNAINFLYDRFLFNGYPHWILNKYLLKSSINNNSSTNNNNNNNNIGIQSHNITYFKVPYISENCSKKLKQIFQSMHLPINIKLSFTNTPPLHRLLSPKSCQPCPTNCNCGNRNECHTKNTVYMVKCEHCDAKYIGETHRTTLSRVSEHIKPQSTFYDHYVTSHNSAPTMSNLSFSVLRKGFHNTLQRKEAEKLYIEENNVLNIMNNS